MSLNTKKILLVYPEFPATYWSFKYALKFIGKKSSFPPLGIITVASMFPENWDAKLVDMNVQSLSKKDIQEADLVFISAMSVQQDSVDKVIALCKKMGKTLVCGGPLFSCEPDRYIDKVDSLMLYEAESNFPNFLKDFQEGNLKNIYDNKDFPKMTLAPMPRWDLIKMNKYATMCLQVSRGCPFDCDFCNVTSLFGKAPRVKDASQVIAELDSLVARGWKGSIFIVDDNFIGNKVYVKNSLLPKLINWQQKQKSKIPFLTEVSINLSDDDSLLSMMRIAGFDTVFIGIETPDEASLEECHKKQNQGRNLVDCVKKIQRYGMQVQAGFIVGFDTDDETIFQRQIDFIQKSSIVMAMVGILQAPAGTKLYEKMKSLGRIKKSYWSGNNVEAATNIIPKMNIDKLVGGYKHIFNKIYSHKNYYNRVITFLKDYETPEVSAKLKMSYIFAFFKANLRLGVFSRGFISYWKMITYVLLFKRELLPTAVTLAIMGLHFRKIYKKTAIA